MKPLHSKGLSHFLRYLRTFLGGQVCVCILFLYTDKVILYVYKFCLSKNFAYVI